MLFKAIYLSTACSQKYICRRQVPRNYNRTDFSIRAVATTSRRSVDHPNVHQIDNCAINWTATRSTCESIRWLHHWPSCEAFNCSKPILALIAIVTGCRICVLLCGVDYLWCRHHAFCAPFIGRNAHFGTKPTQLFKSQYRHRNWVCTTKNHCRCNRNIHA